MKKNSLVVFTRWVICRDVWLRTDECWEREYLGFNQAGQMIPTGCDGAHCFNDHDRHYLDETLDVVKKTMGGHPSATPWRKSLVKTKVRRRLPVGPPRPEDLDTPHMVYQATCLANLGKKS